MTTCGTGTWTGPLPGDPDNNVLLHTTEAFGAIRVGWTFPTTNPHAVANILLYRASVLDYALATRIAVATGDSYLDLHPDIITDTVFYYWIKVVSVNGTVGSLIGPAMGTARPKINTIITELSGKIDSSALSTALRTEITSVGTLASQASLDVATLTDINTLLSNVIDGVQGEVDVAKTLIQDEAIERTNQNSALAYTIDSISAGFNSSFASIVDEDYVFVDGTKSLAGRLNSLALEIGDIEVGVDVVTSGRIDALEGITESTYVVKLTADGLVGGFGIHNDSDTVEAGFDVDTFWVGKSSGNPQWINNTVYAVNAVIEYKQVIWRAKVSHTSTLEKIPLSTGVDNAWWENIGTTVVKPFIISGGEVYIDQAVIKEVTVDKLRTALGGVIIEDGLLGSSNLGINWNAVEGANRPADSATRNVFRGAWVSGTAYAIGDTVYANGSSWVCILGHTAAVTVTVLPVLPITSNTYWVALAVQGAVGSQGSTGLTGASGSQGPTGPAGTTLYTWIAYANNSTGTLGFTVGVNTGQPYIGIANNQTSPTEEANPLFYTWSLIKGTDGVPGSPGDDGITTYTWFAYSNNATGTSGFTTGAWTNQTYLGIAANKTTATESTDPAQYSWSKIEGPAGVQGTTGSTGAAGSQGPTGPAGATLYTWIAYANNSTGSSGFTIGAWTNQTYIGIANNKSSSIESTNPVDYTWSLIKGDAGVPGTPGEDGQTTYTWFAYATNATGTTGFTTGAWSNQTYLGIAVNKTTAVESTNPADYSWSKIEGPIGATGATGSTGPTGAVGPAGTNTFTTVFSNEAHVIPTDSDGNNGIYTGSGTTIYLYEGASALTYDGVGTSNGTWKATRVGSGITPGAITDSGTFATVAQHSAMTLDAATVTYTITGKTLSGAAISLTKVQTLSKSKQGVTGSQGPSVVVTPNRQATFTATDGNLEASQANIVFTAATSGITSPTYVWSQVGCQVEPTASTTNTYTVTQTNFGTAKSVIITCVVSGLYTDKITIVRLERSTDSSQLAGDLSGNPFMTRVDTNYDRPWGVKATYSSTDPLDISYTDSTRTILSIKDQSLVDETVGAVWPAFRVQPNMRYRIFLRWRATGPAIVSTTAGVYFRFLTKTTEIASGKTHIGYSVGEAGTDLVDSSAVACRVVSDTNGIVLGNTYENRGVTAKDTWFETVLEYTPVSNILWASFCILKWTSFGASNALEIDSCFIYAVTTAADGATVGADWSSNISNIPYEAVFNNDDSVAYGFNPTFSAWAGTYPDGWSSSGIWTVSKDTVIKRIGTQSVKCVSEAGTNQYRYITKRVDFSTSPLPIGTFISGTLDVYLASRISGSSPGIKFRVFTNAALTSYVDSNVAVNPAIVGLNTSSLPQWQRLLFTVRVGATQQIYGIQPYLMVAGSTETTFNGTAGVFVGTVHFDNFRFALFDSSIDNKTIELSANGTLSGAGGGSVTITGLGYSGALDATNGAPTGTYVGGQLAETLVSNASTALSTANTASGNATTALNQLTDIVSDSKLTADEKPQVVLDYNTIIAEQNGIDTQAIIYGITDEKTAYDGAISTLTTYLNGLTGWNVIPGSAVTIVGTDFRIKFQTVYTTRQTLLNAISAKAKVLADAAQEAADDKSKAYYQDTLPVLPGIGDLWKNAFSEIPSLDLRFDLKQLDSRITFTRNSIGTYFDSTGLLRTAQANEARFDHDPLTGECLGLLAEKQAVNYFLDSEHPDGIGGTWVDQTSVLNPDGTQAKAYIPSTTNAIHSYPSTSVLDITALSVGTATKVELTAFTKDRDTYRPYFVMRATDGTVIKYLLGQANGVDGLVTISTPGSGWSAASSTVQLLKNGWRRVSLKGTYTKQAGDTGLYGSFQVWNGAGTQTYAGDGVSGVYLWGTHFGIPDQSYIPTSGSTVTRSADNYYMTGTNFSSWYRQDEGSFACIAHSPKGIVVFGTGDTFDNTQYLSIGLSNNLAVRASAVNQANLTTPVNVSGDYNITYTYALNNFASSVNGSTPIVDTVGIVPINQVRLGIGSSPWGTTDTLNSVNGHIKRLSYYPKKLSTDYLKSLSSGVYPGSVGRWNGTSWDSYTDPLVANVAMQTNALTSAINDIASDSLLTANEKPAIKMAYDSIIAEQLGISSEAIRYVITTEKTNYESAVNYLTSYLGTLTTPYLWSDYAGSTVIVGDTFRGNFLSVYNTRQLLLNAITAKSKTLITDAQNAADTAGDDATAALDKLFDIASDSVLTPGEKPAVMKEVEILLAEENGITTQASQFGITSEKNGYTNSLYLLNSYLSGLNTPSSWNSFIDTTSINSITFNNYFKEVYSARQILLNAIALKAKSLADTAQIKANDAWDIADAAEIASTNANNEITKIADDALLSKYEKAALLKEWNALFAEKESINTQATSINFALLTQNNTFKAAFVTLSTYLNDGNVWSAGTPAWFTNLTTDQVINGTTFRAAYSTYYTARQVILNAIATKAGQTADYQYVGGTKPPADANNTTTALQATTTITAGGITFSGGGSIKGGQSDYNTGTGFFLGYSVSGTPGYKFSIGNPDGSRLLWTGTALDIVGTFKTVTTAGDTIAINGSAIAFYRNGVETGKIQPLSTGVFFDSPWIESNRSTDTSKSSWQLNSYPSTEGMYFHGGNGYGVTASCGTYGKGPIKLVPSTSSAAPTHSADLGTLWVTSAGVLYINTSNSTTWQKVGAQ